MPDTAQITKNLRVDKLWAWGNPNKIVLLKNIAKQWLQVKMCYTHWSVPCSAIIKEDSSCSRWDQTQRSRAGQMCRVRDPGMFNPKRDVSIRSFLTMLRKLGRKGARNFKSQDAMEDTKETSLLSTGVSKHRDCGSKHGACTSLNQVGFQC